MNIHECQSIEGCPETARLPLGGCAEAPPRPRGRTAPRRAVQSFKIGAPSRRRPAPVNARHFARAKKSGGAKNRRRHSPFAGPDGSVGWPGTPAAARSRNVASSSDASGTVSRLISPQLGPSGHIAIYQNVYYVALACFAVEFPPSSSLCGSGCPLLGAPQRRRLRNARSFLVALEAVAISPFLSRSYPASRFASLNSSSRRDRGRHHCTRGRKFVV